MKYVKCGNLQVKQVLLNFVNKELLKGSKISPKKFWSGLDKTLHLLTPKNENLIRIRNKMQFSLDEWNLNNKNKNYSTKAYKKFYFL